MYLCIHTDICTVHKCLDYIIHDVVEAEQEFFFKKKPQFQLSPTPLPHLPLIPVKSRGIYFEMIFVSHNFAAFSLLDSLSSLSLSSLLRILPLGLLGTTSINSTPPCSHLYGALLFSTCCCSSLMRLASLLLWREAEADLTMKALGSSPVASLGMGITAASAT